MSDERQVDAGELDGRQATTATGPHRCVTRRPASSSAGARLPQDTADPNLKDGDDGGA